MFDLQLLRDYMYTPTVLDALNLDYKYKSNRYWILCPYHNDSRIGSAYVTEAGYFVCHSCGTKTDLFDLVMKVENCDFRSASVFISELFGGASRFGLNEDEVSESVKEYKKFRLTAAEMEALAFPSTLNLKPLYFYNTDTYKKIILDRANTVVAKYREILKKCCRRDAVDAVKVFELFGTKTDAATYKLLSNTIKERIVLCEEIIERLAA